MLNNDSMIHKYKNFIFGGDFFYAQSYNDYVNGIDDAYEKIRSYKN
jgi:hypothetical protein